MQYGKLIDSTLVLSMVLVCLVSLEALINGVIADPNLALPVLIATGLGVTLAGLDRLAEIWEIDYE